MEISIEIPPWLVTIMRKASDHCSNASATITETYSSSCDFLNHQNNFWWFLSSLVIFWPLWVYFAVTMTAASTWIFWLVASMMMGVLQVIYVTYQFFMIAADVTVLTVLKTYQKLMRSWLVNTIFFFSKRLRNSRQRTSRRRQWRMECEAAKCYNDFLNIHILEPACETGRMPCDADGAGALIIGKSNTRQDDVQNDGALPPLKQHSSPAAMASPILASSSGAGSPERFSTSSRRKSMGTMRTLHEHDENEESDVLATPPRTVKRSRSYDASKEKSMWDLSIDGEMQDDLTKELIRNELGHMAADLLISTTARLKEARHSYGMDDDSSLEHLLTGVVKRNHLTLEDLQVENGRSMGESGQYKYSLPSRKVIAAYYDEVSKGIDTLAEAATYSAESLLELSSRMTLLRKMKQNVGRTALMLSGGGAQAMYHLGTIRALIDGGLYDEIKVISGTSGGSITAAMCALRTSQELYEDVCIPTVSTDFLKTGRMKRENIRWFPLIQDMITYWFKHRLLVDSSEFRRTCEFYYSDTTFDEAFQRSGKHVCITVSASRATGGTVQRLLLNHISTPHVTLASAVTASCALPGVMAPAKLQTKNADGSLEPFEVDGVEWIDGSVQADLPFQRISTLFNVSNYVVAQTNFHVLPFLRKEHHPSTRSLYWRLFQTMEWDIRNRALKLSRLGLFPRIFGQDVSKVFKQKYYGNLTLVPRFTAMQTFGLKALVNPTVKDMEGYLKFGQIAAWPYLKVMRDMIRLESALDFSLSRLRERCRELLPELEDIENYDDLESYTSGGANTSSRSANHHLRWGAHAGSSALADSSSDGLPPRQVRFFGRKSQDSEFHQHSLRCKLVTVEAENAKLKEQMEQMKMYLKLQGIPVPTVVADDVASTATRLSTRGSEITISDSLLKSDNETGEEDDDDEEAKINEDQHFNMLLMKHSSDERRAMKVVKKLSLIDN